MSSVTGNKIKFSIIVVCLNPGYRLAQTLASINNQKYDNYEIIVKDGWSQDGSVDEITPDEKTNISRERDKGIYDAMHQAVSHVTGDFILFMNCGDNFMSDTVLADAEKFILQAQGAQSYNPVIDRINYQKSVYYGDTYSSKTNSLISSPPKIDGFACYRNIPCHQSCFYEASLCKEKPYDLNYKIRADYDHFLWCYYVAKADIKHMGIVVSAYEGGGYSESKANRRRDKEEHGLITKKYMSRDELFKYRLIMALTLSPIRKAMAESKTLSGLYHGVVKIIYGNKK